MSDRVTLTVVDGVADVRLARPDKLNALDPAMFDAIAATIDRLAGLEEVGCVVLSGEGRGFCAGLDMASMSAGGAVSDLLARTHGDANLFQQVAWGWRTLPQPVIAAIHGVALGGGLQIASGADIRLAQPGTRFAVREVHWGIVPDMAGMALWRGIRDDVLRELVYTAREFDAEEAARLGFVTRLTDDPLAAALSLAAEIATRSRSAVRAAKRLLALSHQAEATDILLAESVEQARLIGSPEQMAQVRANLSAPR